MSNVSALSPAVRDYVRGFVARGRRLSLLRGVGIAAAVFLTTLLVSCAIDRMVPLPSPVRLALLCAGCAPSLLLVGIPLTRLLRRDTDWVAVAQRIEQQGARFDQRLVTVISRLLGRPEHRGSEQILDHLVFELDQEVAGENAAGLLPLRPVATPWIVVSALLLLIVAGARVPGVGVAALVHRFVTPLGDLPPVTTTQLRVTPGSRDLAQSSALQIEAEVDHAGGGSVWLLTSEDGGHNWSRLTMNPTADGHFLFTLGSVDRDLRYYVAAGDAQSPQYDVRVLRRPAVSEFRLRYIYPNYTGRSPLNATNTDGVIEAPVGTEVVMTVVSTEPLQSALLTVGGEKSLMTQTGADNSRQGRLTVLKDDRYDLDLISTREQSGTGPGTMSIRALPDRAPIVRLLQPAGPLSLHRDDVAAVIYEANDDYGLDSMDVRAFVNGAQVKDVALAGSETRADAPSARQRQGTVVIDLAALSLHVGDAVSLAVTARDSAGSATASDRLPILIAPRRVDGDAYDRWIELDAARRAAELLESELDEALAAVDAAGATPRPPQSTRAAQARVNRGLAEAAEAASMIRRALLRATVRSPSARLCDFLAVLIDIAQQDASTAEAMFRAGGEPSADPRSAAVPVRQLRDSAARLASDLRTLAAGERADILLLNRENLAAIEGLSAPTDAKAADSRNRALERLHVAIASSASELGIDPEADNAPTLLAARVEEADRLIRLGVPVDFGAAAVTWSKQLRKVTVPPAFDERLSAAAQAQAVRPDADWSRAHDLQLASRAAAVIRSITNDRSASESAGRFITALKSLDHEHAVAGSPLATRPSSVPAEVKDQATAARQVLSAIGAENDAVTGRPRPGLELLAYEASARAQAGNYLDAALTDRSLLRLLSPVDGTTTSGPTTSPRVPQPATDFEHLWALTKAARELDDSENRQRSLYMMAYMLTKASPDSVSGLLARQQEIADKIAAAGRTPGTSTGFVLAEFGTTLSVWAHRDPVAQALSVTRNAADEIERSSTDLEGVRRAIGAAINPLVTARHDLLRQVAMQRLGLLPGLRPILQPGRGGDALAGALPDKPRSQGAAARDWRRGRPRGTDVVSGPHESDPSEYEPALRAYFDAINKARDTGK